jgi:uncharacterized cupredoxin-like copper-binding protein
MAAILVLILALAGCGGSSGGGTSTATTTTPPASTPSGGGGGGSGKTVDVTLADFSITLAGGNSLTPGAYTFHVTNNGATDHNLTINGPGVSDQATPTFGGGESKDLTVTLQNGTYEFFCSVPGHKEAGMDVNVTVSG